MIPTHTACPLLTLLALVLLSTSPAPAHPADEAAALLTLRVDETGLRHELDVPRSLLQQVTGWTLPATGPEAAEFLKCAFPIYFEGRNPVYVDGLEVPPRLREVGYADASRLESSATAEDPLVYVVLEYPTSRPPDRVDMVWTWTELFDKAGERVPAAHGNLVAPGGNKPMSFSDQKRTLSWRRPGIDRKSPAGTPASDRARQLEQVSLVLLLLSMAGVWWLGAGARRLGLAGIVLALLAASAVLVGASRQEMPAVEATRLFGELIEKVYRSIDGGSEEEVHDRLAKSMDGELLERTYREIHEGLFPDHREKPATVRILAVDVLDAEPVSWQGGILGDPGFRVRARWRVRGLVAHRGHVHARTREFAAIYRVARRDATWKLVDCEVLDVAAPSPDPQ